MRLRWLSLGLIAGFVVAACGPAPVPTPTVAEPTVPPATAIPTSAPPPTATLAQPTQVPTAAPTTDPLVGLLGAPLANIGYQIPLITRHAAQHEAVLEFALDQPAQGHILVVPDGGQGAPITLPFEGTGGLFTASGLAPGGRYRAAVALDTPDGMLQPEFQGQAWGEVRFQTQPGTPSEFRVAVLGDSGFGQPETAQLGALIASYNVDFSLHTGDLVYDLQDNPSPPEGFQTKLFAPLAPLLRSAPFYPSLGNHDLEAAARWHGGPYALEAFPPFKDPAIPDIQEGDGGWYAFAQRGVQFVVLNSQVAFGYPGRTDETNWLAERLADPRFAATIVVLHVPIYNAGYHMLDSLPVRNLWGDVIASANVPLVLSGHDHNYQRFEVSGTTYVTTGGGSTHLYEIRGHDPNLKASLRMTHFVLLTFTANDIKIQAIDLSGKVFDETQIPWPGWPSTGSAGPDRLPASLGDLAK